MTYRILLILFAFLLFLSTENAFAFAPYSSDDWLLDLTRCRSLFFMGNWDSAAVLLPIWSPSLGICSLKLCQKSHCVVAFIPYQTTLTSEDELIIHRRAVRSP